MPFVLTAALKDIRRLLTDPAALLIWMGLPVVLGMLMGTVAGGGRTTPKAHVLVADQDQSMASRLLLTMSRQGQLADFLDVESVSLEDGRRRMAAGEATALLIVPSGFQTGVLDEEPTELTLITNPSQRILPGIIEEGLGMLVETAFYAHRMFGEPIHAIRAAVVLGGGRISEDQVASMSRFISQRMQGLAGTLAPPLLQLESVPAPTDNTAPVNIGVLFLPGLIFMSVLLISQGATMDIWVEKERGTLRRSLSTPRPAAVFLAGKIVAGAVLMAVVALIAVTIAVLEFDVSVWRGLLAFAWACYAGVAVFCYFVLIQMLGGTQRGANLISSLVVFPAMMIGGSFFPFDSMPAWMASVGRWTPNGLAVAWTKQILFGTPTIAGLVTPALGIGVPALVAFLLSARRLTRGFAVN